MKSCSAPFFKGAHIEIGLQIFVSTSSGFSDMLQHSALNLWVESMDGLRCSILPTQSRQRDLSHVQCRLSGRTGSCRQAMPCVKSSKKRTMVCDGYSADTKITASL